MQTENLTAKAPRQSNIELLRIVAMIMIIAHHFSFHGGFKFSSDTITATRFWVQFLLIGGKIGVNIFMLISGYFLVSARSLKTNKVLKLWLQIFTYSVGIFIVFSLCGAETFGIKKLIKLCFPITYSQWWFASTYFILYLLSPYINKLLHSLDKKQYQHFLLLLGFCWCIIPTLTAQANQSNNLLWFVFLYAFAGYIRLFKPQTNIKGSTYIWMSIAVTLLTFLSAVVSDFLGTKIEFFYENATILYGMRKFPIFLIAAMLFIGFLKTDIGYKPVINTISSATFGVYLIHDNKYIRPFLWKTLFKNASYAENNILIPYSLLVIAAVFIGCTVIELARIHILEKRYARALDSAADKIDEKIKKGLLQN